MAIVTFDDWMKAVDNWCWQLAGCSIYDLSDHPFDDWFECGFSPKEAAMDALWDEG